MKSDRYEPKECEICGKEYTPRRSDQRTCLGEDCMKERQRLNRIEYRRRNYGRVLENNRRAMEKRRAERYLAEHPPKPDTIVAIGYADRQREKTLAMVGKGKHGIMISAIIIIVLLGLLDLMLFVACVELEKDRRIERNDNGNDNEGHGL